MILLSSFQESPRHMQEYAQDSIAYVRVHGNPNLLITFVCNLKWPEILKILFEGQKATDRHIVARVFQQKLRLLMKFITEHCVFGDM